MERRENDKLLPEHAKDASYPEDWWLDEADSADGLPVFAMDEAEDFVKDRQRLKGVPILRQVAAPVLQSIHVRPGL